MDKKWYNHGSATSLCAPCFFFGFCFYKLLHANLKAKLIIVINFDQWACHYTFFRFVYHLYINVSIYKYRNLLTICISIIYSLHKQTLYLADSIKYITAYTSHMEHNAINNVTDRVRWILRVKCLYFTLERSCWAIFFFFDFAQAINQRISAQLLGQKLFINIAVRVFRVDWESQYPKTLVALSAGGLSSTRQTRGI